MNRAGTTGSGKGMIQEGWSRASYAEDTWQILLEHGLLIRKHETPRAALFSPDSIECPLDKSHLSNIRTTEMAMVGGGFKRNHDTWGGGCQRGQSMGWKDNFRHK